MDIKTLRILVGTLNQITVSGKDNIAKLLVCINTLENALKTALEQQKGDDDTK
ncbi:MAG: hypothetical protein IIX61_08765 [Loktanella sp.]|nr:hypothetical protein [Loktanella sp.]